MFSPVVHQYIRFPKLTRRHLPKISSWWDHHDDNDDGNDDDNDDGNDDDGDDDGNDDGDDENDDGNDDGNDEQCFTLMSLTLPYSDSFQRMLASSHS